MQGRAREGEMVGDGDERAQKLGVEVGTAHKKPLSSSLRLFDSFSARGCLSMVFGGMEWKLWEFWLPFCRARLAGPQSARRAISPALSIRSPSEPYALAAGFCCYLHWRYCEATAVPSE